MSAFALKLSVSQGGLHRETIDIPSFYEAAFYPFCQAVRSLVPDADLRKLTWEDAQGKHIALQNDKDLNEAFSNTLRAEDGKIVLKIHVACPEVRQPMKQSQPKPINTSGRSIQSLGGPPAPRLAVRVVDGQGIRLKWDVDVPEDKTIVEYEIYAKQGNGGLPNSIGTVAALLLPMACTLTQFHVGVRYAFQVRAKDSDGIWGPLSVPADIAT